LGDGTNKGIRRIINAGKCSAAGFKAAWINEEAFRQEITLAVLIVPLGFWLGKTGTQRSILIGIYFIIPLTELLNSAIEAVVDRVGQERHELARRAKDLGSAAVVLSICIASIVWVIIACERFF
jgi:diacylglycerol kinase (ATP)